MPRTPSSASRVSVSNGAARRTMASSSSTVNRSADRHRDELLGEDVERVARQRRLLDRAVVHALDDDGGLEEVAAVLGEDHALARLADLVPGAADALEAARDGGGALDLDHEVDGAHVDAELEAATSRRGRGGGRL